MDEMVTNGLTEPALKDFRLFSPVTLRGITARNRIVVSPMCQYKSVDGGPTDWHLVNLGRYAIGGAGIVFCEETAVEARGRKTHHCAGIYDESHVPAYRRITDFLRSMGAVPAIQLGHAGASASARGPMEGRASLTAEDLAEGLTPWQPISAGTVPPKPHQPAPRAMTRDDIAEVIASWKEAARRSDEAGFDICEIHGAHGYLIHQFLSPVTNQRTDDYGGDRKRRMRFALEVVDAVRAAWPAHKPLFFRVSSVDGKGGLWSLEDTIALAMELKERGVDLIDCSSGGILGASELAAVPRVPGYHVPYARAVKRATGIAAMGAGFIIRADQAEALLVSGDVDLIPMARELMLTSEWPVHAAVELGAIDHFELFPKDFAWRLKGREEARAMAINAPDTAKIPTGVGTFFPAERS